MTTERPNTSWTALTAAQIAKMKEREAKVREIFQDEAVYTHANTSSTVNEQSIREFRKEYKFPDEYSLKAPTPEERMYWRPNSSYLAVPVQILKNGVRFPLHPFISDFLDYVGIGFAQLVPNSYIHLICFVAFCKDLDLKPSLDFFFSIFTLTRSKEPGFRALNRLPNQKVWMQPPSSNKGWHNNWFFASGPDTHLIQPWGNPEKPIIEPLEGERRKEFKQFCKNIPAEPWDIELLQNQQWLFDHGLVIIYKPQPRPQTLVLSSGASPEQNRPPIPKSTNLPPSSSRPQTGTELPPFPEENAFKMSDLEKQQLRRKKRRRLVKTSEAPIYVQPINSSRPLTPSPPSSPSPVLGEEEAPPQSEHPPSPHQSPAPISINSEPPSPQSEARATSSQPGPTGPDPSQSLPLFDFSKLSFFPDDTSTPVPKQLFGLFNLATDDQHFNSTNPDSLTTSIARHLGQALGGFSRLLLLQNKSNDQSVIISTLQNELQKVQDDHIQLQKDHKLLQENHSQLQEDQTAARAQIKADDTLIQSLQTQLLEHHHQQKSLEDKVLGLSLERTQLVEDRVERNKRLEHLLQQNRELEEKVQAMTDQVKQKDEVLHVSATANKVLEEENQQLKTQAQTLLEDNRYAIIEEYKKSKELKDAVVAQYDEGYMYAKNMIKAAGLNPINLGFSSDEDADEEEEEPSSSRPDPTSGNQQNPSREDPQTLNL